MKKLIKKRLGEWIERFPYLWKMLMVFRYRNHPFVRRLVSPKHDLVIEGYPRSANSFSVKCFFYSNGWLDAKVATHTHSPAQVSLAAKWGVPTMVLFRDPDQAVVSFLALSFQSGSLDGERMDEKKKLQWIQYMTRRYVHYYEEIIKVKDKILLVSFSEATNDFGGVLEKLNSQYGKSFEYFEHSKASIDKIFSTSQKHLSPNDDREKIKKNIKEIYFSKGNEVKREEARKVYSELSRLAG
jgi:hypothetical protein